MAHVFRFMKRLPNKASKVDVKVSEDCLCAGFSSSSRRFPGLQKTRRATCLPALSMATALEASSRNIMEGLETFYCSFLSVNTHLCSSSAVFLFFFNLSLNTPARMYLWLLRRDFIWINCPTNSCCVSGATRNED